MTAARKRVEAIAKGRGRNHRVVVPLAFEVAARISARPVEQFRNDATQLANGLGELQRAIDADGIVVSLAGGMELAASGGAGLDPQAIVAGAPVAASLEACARLRQTFDDRALLAGLTGPVTLAQQFQSELKRAGECVAALVKAFCEAGADIVVLFEDADGPLEPERPGSLATAGNIARFHQACLLDFEGDTLPAPVRQSLSAPSVEGLGIITTDRPVPADADIETLRRWVAAVRGE